MRHYLLSCYSHGHHAVPNAPTYCTGTAKVGEVAIVVFCRVFGRQPDRDFWQSKGFMAEARDRRGNGVMVNQINDDDLPGFDPATGRFPLVLVRDSAAEN